MASLIGTFNDMVKEAEESSKIELLAKYAEAAVELMQAEFPNNHTPQDVLELADALIQNDIAVAEQGEKLASFEQAGAEYALDLLKGTNG